MGEAYQNEYGKLLVSVPQEDFGRYAVIVVVKKLEHKQCRVI